MPTNPQNTRHIARTFDYYVALDNYEPVPRTDAYGTATVWEDSEDPDYLAIVLGPDLSWFDRAYRGIFLIDDGKTIEPFYAAAWHPEKRDIIIHRFPTNYTREDGRAIDFGTWALGPRLAFHLKVRP